MTPQRFQEVLTELRRLRAENQRLRARVAELQDLDKQIERTAALDREIAMLSQADRFKVRQVISALIAERFKPPLMEPPST